METIHIFSVRFCKTGKFHGYQSKKKYHCHICQKVIKIPGPLYWTTKDGTKSLYHADCFTKNFIIKAELPEKRVKEKEKCDGCGFDFDDCQVVDNRKLCYMCRTKPKVKINTGRMDCERCGMETTDYELINDDILCWRCRQ